MRFRKLRGRIRECYGTQIAFATAMEMSPTTLSKKLNGQTEWTRAEIDAACLLLQIPADEIHVYFFA